MAQTGSPLEEFAGLVGLNSTDAAVLFKASAATMFQAVSKSALAEQKSYLVPLVEATAAHPPAELLASFPITLGDEDQAVAILRAAAQVFLNQADRDRALGLNRASSIAVEVRRAAQLEIAADDSASDENTSASLGPSFYNKGDAGFGFNDSRDVGSESFAPRGPHGSGGGWDD